MIINFTKRIRKKFIVIIIFISIFGVYMHRNNIKNNIEVINTKQLENTNKYSMDVIFEDESKRLVCNQTITYINKTDKKLDNIYLHIYPNAFSKKEYAPFEESEMDEAYPNGFNEGYIDIKKIASGSTKLKYDITGTKEDILNIKLEKTINPGESLNIDFKYNVKLPNSLGRFGYGEDTINVTNWFPIMCVYDERGWNIKGYEAIGDPFYSDTSFFDIKLLIPSKYKIASTGAIKNSKTNNDKTIYYIEAKNVRDFAFIISDKFKIKSGKVDNIKVYSYYLNDDMAKFAFDVSKESISIFNELFGKYPYENYSVIASDFFIGGMEYPNIGMIDKTLYDKDNKFYLEYVIAHETAHQWWYSVIGNDEISEPWIDEALTEYSTILYFEKKYGKEISENLLKNMENRSLKHSSIDIFKSTNQYSSSREYSVKVYTKGAVIFDKIRKDVGDSIFFETLNEYYDEYMFKNVNGAKFVELWNKKGIDLNKLLNKYK